MTRNTLYRVEVAVEILSQPIKEKLLYLLATLDRDNVKARVMDAEGTYHHVPRQLNEPLIDSQRVLYNYFAQEKAVAALTREQEALTHEEKGLWSRLKELLKR